MKIAVIGTGSIGSRHHRNLIGLGHDVRAFDPAKGHGGSERALYDWCDAAVIATPSHLHEGPLRACIERGKHALVEKPISTSIGGLPVLLAEAFDKGLTIMMGNNLRFHPCVKAMEPLAVIERPVWANFICATTTTRNIHDGALLNIGSHEVDLALHLFGPAEVACASVIKGDGVIVMADFVLKHDRGIRSSFHLDLMTETEIRRFTVGCARSVHIVDLPMRKMESRWRDGDWLTSWKSGSYDDDYIDEAKAFIEAIEGKPSRGASGDDGLSTLHLLLDIAKAAHV